MLWRKLNRVFYRKGSVLTVMLVIFWGIAGMFLQYQLYCMESSHLKWRPLEKMGDDWYYYMSDAAQGKPDAKKQAIQQMGSALGMWQLRAHAADHYRRASGGRADVQYRKGKTADTDH